MTTKDNSVEEQPNTTDLPDDYMSEVPFHNWTIILLLSFFCIIGVFGLILVGYQLTRKEPTTQKSIQPTDVPNAPPESTVSTKSAGINELVPQTTPTPTPLLVARSYKSPDVGYSLSYLVDWTLTQTYGKGISKLAPSDIIEGIQLSVPNQYPTFVLNVYNPKGHTSVVSWWNANGPDRGYLGGSVSKPNYTFKGNEAVLVTFSDTDNGRHRTTDHIYFYWKNTIYFLSLQYYTNEQSQSEVYIIANSLQLP